MKKNKLTRKEIKEALDTLNNNGQYLYDKILQIDNLLGLYLEYRKETDKFSKFVKSKVDSIEKQRSKTENTKGA